MKRFTVLAAVLCVSCSFFGCSSTDSVGQSSNENTTVAAGSDENTSESSVSNADATSTENGSETENVESPTDDDTYFRDNVLVTDDFKIEITDYQVIPAGETGNEYGDTPVIAFWYDTTNTSGTDIDPSTAWIYSLKAIQDNDPNAINELDMGMLPDDSFLDSQLETIKKDGTVSNAVSYELDDDFTPVTLVATNGLFGDELGQQEYSIN